MIKGQIRVLGIDDSPFSFDQKRVTIIGVVMRVNGYIEGVLKDEVDVDGRDATDVLINMINRTRHHDQIRVTMIDGIAFGGFNVIDVRQLHRETSIPVITITRNKPDFDAILSTLKIKFSDWEERWNKIKDNKLYRVETSHNPIYITVVGITRKEAEEIIMKSTIRGVIPEPIRVAHLIASGIVRGESYGKA